MKGRLESVKKYLKSVLIGIVTGAANGLFGSGGGTIAVPAMVLLLKTEEHKAHATAISIILPLTLVSAFMYIKSDFINWDITIKVMLGGIAGGYIGAKLLNVCPANILRKIFGIFMVLAAFRMLF
ncbi:MAG TPA: sulfite exporter TauE/SafE family protein [Clostridiaceae bacterium]|nr:sulfite exporter TauE/SafE family protein [Clostridiaceae bacterium]